jgi:ketosteroid isomerase-like protein
MSLMVPVSNQRKKFRSNGRQRGNQTEIQAMEDAFAEAYNNSNADGINYYAEDAVSFQTVKCR